MTSFSRKLTLALAFGAACISSSYAATYTEAFEASFPTWESGWLGANSNLQNYYGVGGDRGNNPDGLWIQDGLSLDNETRITFAAAFGQTLTSLSLDIATYRDDLHLEIFDSLGVILGSWYVAPTNGAYTDPGLYMGFGIQSISGVGGFRLLGTGIEGNTSIDNVIAISGAPVVPGPSVPDDASTLILSGLSLAALLTLRRRMSN